MILKNAARRCAISPLASPAGGTFEANLVFSLLSAVEPVPEKAPASDIKRRLELCLLPLDTLPLSGREPALRERGQTAKFWVLTVLASALGGREKTGV